MRKTGSVLGRFLKMGNFFQNFSENFSFLKICSENFLKFEIFQNFQKILEKFSKIGRFLKNGPFSGSDRRREMASFPLR